MKKTDLSRPLAVLETVDTLLGAVPSGWDAPEHAECASVTKRRRERA